MLWASACNMQEYLENKLSEPRNPNFECPIHGTALYVAPQKNTLDCLRTVMSSCTPTLETFWYERFRTALFLSVPWRPKLVRWKPHARKWLVQPFMRKPFHGPGPWPCDKSAGLEWTMPFWLHEQVRPQEPGRRAPGRLLQLNCFLPTRFFGKRWKRQGLQSADSERRPTCTKPNCKTGCAESAKMVWPQSAVAVPHG